MGILEPPQIAIGKSLLFLGLFPRSAPYVTVSRHTALHQHISAVFFYMLTCGYPSAIYYHGFIGTVPLLSQI